MIGNLGAADIDSRMEEQLNDGILYAFQEQTSDDSQVMLNGFGTVINALGLRCKPYLPQICSVIKVILQYLYFYIYYKYILDIYILDSTSSRTYTIHNGATQRHQMICMRDVCV